FGRRLLFSISLALCLNRVPDVRFLVLTKKWNQRLELLKLLTDEMYLIDGIQVCELAPLFFHEFTELVSRSRNGQSRKRCWEPAIGRTKQDRFGTLTAPLRL